MSQINKSDMDIERNHITSHSLWVHVHLSTCEWPRVFKTITYFAFETEMGLDTRGGARTCAQMDAHPLKKNCASTLYSSAFDFFV